MSSYLSTISNLNLRTSLRSVDGLRSAVLRSLLLILILLLLIIILDVGIILGLIQA